MTVETVTLGREGTAGAADALARAFAGDAAYVDLVPAAARRLDVLRPMFGAVVCYAYTFGVVTTTAEIEGAACWIAPGKAALTPWRTIRTGIRMGPMAVDLVLRMAGLGRDARRRFRGGEAHVDRVHARLMPRPHWYLWALGVRPEAQRRGIGGALLRPILARADVEGVPCYLETQTEDNVRFYERRGFDVVAADELPGQRVSLPMWYMVREARTPVREARTPVREARTPVREARTSVREAQAQEAMDAAP